MEKPIEDTNKPTKQPLPPGNDLAVAAAFWIWGMMLNYFPTYAGIPPEFAWLFQIPGYACYAVGFFGAIVGVNKLARSKFLENVGFGLGFFLVAYIMHFLASNFNAIAVLAFLLRLIALILTGIGVAGVAIGIPYLFFKPQGEMVQNSLSQPVTPNVESTSLGKSKPEQILSIIIALLALLTAIIPLLRAWLRIP